MIEHIQNMPTCALVFTDLDGTLLDHDSYDFEAALPAIHLLQSLNIPLIPTTSKTVAEVLQFNQLLNNSHPFIAENGCVIALPENYFDHYTAKQSSDFHIPHGEPYKLITLVPGYAHVLAALRSLRDTHGFQFRGFDDLTTEEVSELTQLPMEKAQLAKQRLCSEPLVWLDSESNFQVFRSQLQRQQLQLVKGGRFWHVFGHTDKGRAMQKLKELYCHYGNANYTTIALGDSPNDIDMLNEADIAVVIRRKDGSRLDYDGNDQQRRVIISEKPGPAGWNDAITSVFEHTNQ